jgi:N-methylhydantoinase A
MKEVAVPPTPGVLSALGGLIADLKSDFISTVYVDLGPQSAEQIEQAYLALEARAETWLRDDQHYTGTFKITRSAELRYRGQSFEIDTPVEQGGDWQAMARSFHTEHERVYGHADRHAPIQAIALRVVITGVVEKPEFPRFPLEPGPATVAGHAEVWLDGAFRTATTYRRRDLRAGQSFAGPSVVLQDDCTTVVPAGFDVVVDAYTNLRITLS